MAGQVTLKTGNELPRVFKRTSSRKDSRASARNSADVSFQELYETIQDAYTEWQNALVNFDNADCKDMVDYYSYRIKASQIRYEHLIRKAKELQQVR